MKTHEERIIELELLVKMMAADIEKLNNQVEELKNGTTWDVKGQPGSAYLPHRPKEIL